MRNVTFLLTLCLIFLYQNAYSNDTIIGDDNLYSWNDNAKNNYEIIKIEDFLERKRSKKNNSKVITKPKEDKNSVNYQKKLQRLKDLEFNNAKVKNASLHNKYNNPKNVVKIIRPSKTRLRKNKSFEQEIKEIESDYAYNNIRDPEGKLEKAIASGKYSGEELLELEAELTKKNRRRAKKYTKKVLKRKINGNSVVVFNGSNNSRSNFTKNQPKVNYKLSDKLKRQKSITNNVRSKQYKYNALSDGVWKRQIK